MKRWTTLSISISMVIFLLVVTTSAFAQGGDEERDLDSVHEAFGYVVSFEEIVEAYQPWIDARQVMIIDAREGEVVNLPLIAQTSAYASGDYQLYADMLEDFEELELLEVPEGNVWVLDSRLVRGQYPTIFPLVTFELLSESQQRYQQEGKNLRKTGYSPSMGKSGYGVAEGDYAFENPGDDCTFTFTDAVTYLSEEEGYAIENILAMVGEGTVALYAVDQLGSFVPGSIDIYSYDKDGCLYQG